MNSCLKSDNEKIEEIKLWNIWNANEDETDYITEYNLLNPFGNDNFKILCYQMAENDLKKTKKYYKYWKLSEIYEYFAYKLAINYRPKEDK